jgi:hypothetical protein
MNISIRTERGREEWRGKSGINWEQFYKNLSRPFASDTYRSLPTLENPGSKIGSPHLILLGTFPCQNSCHRTAAAEQPLQNSYRRTRVHPKGLLLQPRAVRRGRCRQPKIWIQQQIKKEERVSRKLVKVIEFSKTPRLK